MLELKLSLTGKAFNDEFDVADEVRLTVFPKQVVAKLEEAVTEVGVGFTRSVFEAVTVPQGLPVAVNVNVTVPEYEAGGVYVAFKVVALGENVPPTPPSLQVPVVDEPPIEPPNVAEVPPLQIAVKAPPASTQNGLKASMRPPVSLIVPVFASHLKFPKPVAPAVVFIPHAAPITGELPVAFIPTSYNSVKAAGEVTDQFEKFVLEVGDAVREQFPKTITAELLVTVVTAGIFDKLAEIAVYQEVGAVTSKGFELFTPEKATIPPTVSDEPVVTENV